MRLEIENIHDMLNTHIPVTEKFQVAEETEVPTSPEGGEKSHRRIRGQKGISFLDSNPEVKKPCGNSLDNLRENAFD